VNEFDLIDTRIPVEIGDKTFEVRQIRVQDIFRITRRFDDEIRAFVREEVPDAGKLFQSLGQQDLADLYSFALDPYAPAHLRAHLTLPKAMEVGILIGSVNDLDRIWKSLKIGSPAPAAEGQVQPLAAETSTVSSMVRIIDRLAARYGIDPLVIPKWPYEAFLTLVDAVDEDVKARERQALLLAGLDPDLLDDSRIKAGPIADLNKLVN